MRGGVVSGLKALAAILVLAALAASVLFLLTGAGSPPGLAPALAAQLGPAAGSPLLALGGALGYVLGVLLAGRRRDAPYALREVTLALCVGASAAFSAALVVGVARTWSRPTLGALALGGASEALVALGLSLRLAFVRPKLKLLFVPGLLGALGLVGLYVGILALGGL